jgi:hypothetical protein
MDWEIFKDKLKFKLAKIPPAQPVVTDNKFQTVAHNLTTTIQDIIEQVLPKSKPNPHSKRWWTKDLTMMHCEVAKLSHLSYRNKSYANHYSHEEYCIKRNQYTKAIKKTKKEHWIDRLEDLLGNKIWMANSYLTASASNGSLSRIPTLKQAEGDNADTNKEQSTALAKAFFLPPPEMLLVPNEFNYPEAVPTPAPLTSNQLQGSISKLSPYKAPGPDGICNIVFIQCADLL